MGRAVAFMCAANQAAKVYLLNRSEEKAQSVACEVNQALETDCVTAMPLSGYQELAKAGERRYLVIQSTSVGLSPNDDVIIEEEAFYRCVKSGYDLIYSPWETKFMKLVAKNGGKAYNGLKMLLYQGIDAFELWNGCKVSEESADRVYKKLQESVRK